MAELVYAHGLGPCSYGVRVRVPPRPPETRFLVVVTTSSTISKEYALRYNVRMKIYDVVWEDQEIPNIKAVQIIKHKAIQRLKKIWISTYGYLYELKRNATRYDHSLGVYLLLKHFGASEEEQLAGLLHDVSHTALSHVSTYAFLSKFTGLEFHEMQQKEFYRTSGLSKLINNLGFDPDHLLHDKKFTLLENNLPDICADRLDYALRDGIHLQILSRQQVRQVLKGLTVYNSEFVFSDIESAFTYSFNFFLLNLMYYGSPAEAHFNNDFGNLVKYAVKNKVLKDSDWFTDDIYLTNKLKNSKNKKIQAWLNKYNNKMAVFEDKENPDEIFPKKIRIVDPKILIKGTLHRLSELSPVYKKIVTDYQKNHKEHEMHLKVVYRD